jgi:GT2 family glycosyltransferase
MVVVDNGSEDHTADVVKSASHPRIAIRYLYEPRPGKSRAQNLALAHASGEALLFTDDDIEPAEGWLESMARPLLEKRCDAVAGKILLAACLQRPWFTKMHRIWLAEVRDPIADTTELVGASMGIRRSVFGTIGNFDEELGPGASGFGEETLIEMQMREAGFRIRPVTDTFVVHYPDATRLLRSDWLATAERFGRTSAYTAYHWKHARVSYPALRILWLRMKLVLRRLPRKTPRLDVEGCPEWEMSYLAGIESLKRFVEESRRPRNYDFRAMRRKEPQLIRVSE